MSHVKASCHMWMRHVACECVMSHVNASCHDHMDESWLMIVTMTQQWWWAAWQWVMTRSNVWHHMCDMTHPWHRHAPILLRHHHNHMCDMTHSSSQSHVWHDSFIITITCVTWLIHDIVPPTLLRHRHNHNNDGGLRDESWLIHMVVESWLIDMMVTTTQPLPLIPPPWHTWVVTYSYMWHDSFICVTWRIRMWHDSFMIPPLWQRWVMTHL